MSAYPRRTLLRALILSLLAHALLLLGVTRILPPMPDAPTASITVSMIPAEKVTESAPAAHAISREEARPVAAIPPEAHQGATEKLVVPERQSKAQEVVSTPTTVVAQDAAAASALARKLSSGEFAGPASREAQPVSGASSNATTLRQDGVSADEVRQYRTLLAMSAKRFKRYPALARERGWEGTVEIALDFRRSLPGPGISLAESSGRQVLDEQALEMIRQAARVTEVPERLQGKDFRVLLPVQFSLEDQR